jgi:hypothetical protein
MNVHQRYPPLEDIESAADQQSSSQQDGAPTPSPSVTRPADEELPVVPVTAPRQESDRVDFKVRGPYHREVRLRV